MSIEIKWLGHSCFKLTAEDYQIVVDPYEDGAIPGLPPLKVSADQVYCSHDHHDHNAAHLIGQRNSGNVNPFSITEINSYHDEEQGAQRGPNTIRIFSVGDLKAVHFGDIGCDPTEEQKALLKHADLIMIPVGGFFTMEPDRVKKLVDELEPKVTIPMHYRSGQFGFDVIKPLEVYLELCDDVQQYDTDTFVLEPGVQKQTAVLHLPL